MVPLYRVLHRKADISIYFDVECAKNNKEYNNKII